VSATRLGAIVRYRPKADTREALEEPSMENDFVLVLVTPVAMPPQSAIASLYKSANLADAYSIQLPPSASSDPDVLARFVFSHQPAWIVLLTKVRDAIVAVFGLKTSGQLARLSGDARGNRVSFFKVYSTTETEIVLGEDDKHLDFRVSLLCSKGAVPQTGHTLTLSTVVHCHNLLGRTYVRLIAPFHRLVAKASLRRAAHVGWPKSAA